MKPRDRILTPEMQEVLADKVGEALSRLIDRYLPAQPTTAPSGPPAASADPFRVLGLRHGSTTADVKRRVRDLAKIFHPDVAGGDGEKMAEINAAADQILAQFR
jgi:hypothetical protein